MFGRTPVAGAFESGPAPVEDGDGRAGADGSVARTASSDALARVGCAPEAVPDDAAATRPVTQTAAAIAPASTDSNRHDLRVRNTTPPPRTNQTIPASVVDKRQTAGDPPAG
ncbi:hypothetical protein GCM10027265_27100 [Jatrophihabitans fulvus]